MVWCRGLVSNTEEDNDVLETLAPRNHITFFLNVHGKSHTSLLLTKNDASERKQKIGQAIVFSFQFFLTHQFKKKKKKGKTGKKVEQEDVRISRSEIKAIELVLSTLLARMKYLALQTL